MIGGQRRFGDRVDLEVEKGRVFLSRDRKARESSKEALVAARESAAM
jgi:hypothetical protein